MPELIRIENAILPAEGRAVRVLANGTPVAVFRIGGNLYGLDARCNHVGGPLDQGAIAGSEVTCPWHHSVFDVRDGKVVHGPATKPVTSYRVRIEGAALILERV
jgi:nitrite reductase/ring-hydroxylating ferredoxin subunit